jgi:tyrosine-protein kinase Etk/Wzc
MHRTGDATFDIHTMSEPHRSDPDYTVHAEREEDTISLLDLLAVVAKRKWLIIGMTVIVGIVTVAFLATTTVLPSTSRWNYLPNYYKPTVKILLQDSSASTSISSLLNQSGLSSLTGLLGGSSLTGKSTSSDLAKALLATNSLEDAVAEKFNFVERYHITKTPKTSVRRMIEGALKVKYDDKSGIMEIGYQDIDPVFATAVINDIADRLQSQFKGLTQEKVVSKKQYLEQSIAAAEQDTADKASQLVAFQNKYGIYDLPAQAEANIRALADLQAQLAQRNMELQLQLKYTPATDVRIIRLKDQIAQLQRQIDEMQAGTGGIAGSSVPLGKMSGLSVQYLNLEKDLEVQQAILSLLKQQYETAKLEEMDNSQTFQVVENAEIPEVKAGPGRSKIAVIAVLAAFFVSVLIAFVAEYFARARQDPVEAEKLSEIRSFLVPRRRPRRE